MSGVSRVSISDSLRKTIQDIKEIAGKHADEDVYAMLKECNMDPNETAQRLLYLDTFHEVKRKRDRRKMSVNNGALVGGRQMPGMQRRDAVDGHRLNARKQNGYNRAVGVASKSSTAVLHKKSNRVPVVASSIALANGSASTCDESSNCESTSCSADCNIRGIVKDTKADYGNKSTKVASLRPVHVKLLPTLDPGPTPTPTPTNTSATATEARIQGGSFKRKSSNLGNHVNSQSVSGLYSSASDPVLEPSLNPRNAGSVGIIKRETGNQRNTAEFSANLLADCRTNAIQNVTIGQVVSGSVDLSSNRQQIESQGDERSHVAESSRPPSSTDQHITAAKVNQETCSVQNVKGPLKVMASEAPDAAPEANLHSHPPLEDPSSEQATSEVDARLHKLHISDRQSVIFPNHLHVPDAFKNALTFGSLDAPERQNNEGSIPRDASVPTHVETAKEPSSTHQSSSPTSGHDDFSDRPQSPHHVMLNLTSSQENVSSGTGLRYGQSKPEMLPPVGGSQNALLPPMPEYCQSLMPPVVGSHTVQLEGHEPQGGNSSIPSATGPTPSITQPRRVAQNSVAVSPQLFPVLRQPYHPNYIPYSPYFSQLYMSPQSAHQMLSHSGYPQQPSAGNIYMSPTAAATSGVKFPIYKPGDIAGNLTHFGISSSYGSYGVSGLGYGSSTALPPGTSADDMAGSELKEKNMYSALKRKEDLHVLSGASGWDTSAFQGNVFYNLAQGQPVAFSAAVQVGHTSFPMSNPSLVQSLLQPQPTVESMVSPLSSYPAQPQLQPQTQVLHLPQQMNWNNKILNRENI